MRLFTYNKVFTEIQFDKESDFEKEVVDNSKLFFGGKTIYIDAKKKIDAKSMGKTVPDGFLFDISDKDNPEFYLVEVELATHDFFNHIFPQITKFFGFYKIPKSLNDLVEKVFTIVNNDDALKEEFKKLIVEKEIYKFLKDTIEQSQNILLIIDDEKKELPEIIDTYSDTWGKMVKVILIRKFKYADEIIYTMHPEFENIEFADIGEEETDGNDYYTEKNHLEGASDEIKKVYNDIKRKITKTNKGIIFNPQKYYISIKAKRNIAFFIFRRKKIVLIVMNSERNTKKDIKYHNLKKLSQGIQKFYNGPSCAIMIDSEKHLNEVIKLLNKLIINS